MPMGVLNKKADNLLAKVAVAFYSKRIGSSSRHNRLSSICVNGFYLRFNVMTPADVNSRRRDNRKSII